MGTTRPGTGRSVHKSHRDTDQWKTSQNTCPDHPVLQPQKGFGIISKSVHLERTKQNLDILDFSLSEILDFSLSETEMKQISSLQTKDASFLHSPDFVQMLCSKWHAAR